MIVTGSARRLSPGAAPIETADRPPAVHRREGRAMGSPLRLQVPTIVPGRLVERGWRLVVDEFEASEQALSRFREASEIHRARLAGGRTQAPSRRLMTAVSAADRARRVTGGRFEPRVLGDLERLGFAPIPMSQSAPEAGAAAWAGRIVDRKGRAGPIRLPAPIDFGGIGKGLALRWAARRLATVLGEAPFLLEAGGDIVANGSPGRRPEDPGWRIGVEDPRAAGPGGVDGAAVDGPLAVVELPAGGGAIATSSVRRARWQSPDGRSVHHLIDPATGEPGGAGLLAVTVQAADPAWSEVWSKALFLEGAQGIGAQARAQGLAAWWVTTAGAVEMTPSARTRTVWLAGEG